MTQSVKNLSRRNFLKQSAVVTSGLVLGFVLPGEGGRMALAAGKKVEKEVPDAWIHIAPDNQITILCGRSEMGQGVITAMPMMIAEELEVDFSGIKVEMAPASLIYRNRLIGAQLTGGSTSTRDGWVYLRSIGASARTMLVRAAAKQWGVAESACRAENGQVIGPNGQHASYGALTAAANQLPVPEVAELKLKTPDQFKIIGKPLPRKDTPAKVNGTAQFGIDVKLPGMLYASIAMCPTLKGKPKSFNADAAKKMPGVRHVVMISDGVVVVADTFWQAKQARDTLQIDWDRGANAHLDNATVFAALEKESVKTGAKVRQDGHFDQAWAQASKKIEAVYELPYLAHATMEPMNFTADVRADGVDIYGGTQNQTGSQMTAAALTGVPADKVRVHTTYLGGGFGRRVEQDFIRQAVEVSKAVGKPVKLIWTREDDMQHDVYRPVARDTLQAALDDKGQLTGLKVHVVSPSITARVFPAVVKSAPYDPFAVEALENFAYGVPNLDVHYVQAAAPVDVGFWRSVSNSLNAFIVEGFIDECAHAAGQDPVQYRHAMLGRDKRLQHVLSLAADKAGWGRAPQGRFQGVACMEAYDARLAQVAEISLDSDGRVRVHRVVCVVDCGQMINPSIVEAQVQSAIIYGLTAALYGEIHIKDGQVQETNFNNYLMVRMDEAPQIDVVLVKSDAKPGGMGEPATALIGPAVANAVFKATGKRLRKLPLTPEAIKA